MKCFLYSKGIDSDRCFTGLVNAIVTYNDEKFPV